MGFPHVYYCLPSFWLVSLVTCQMERKCCGKSCPHTHYLSLWSMWSNHQRSNSGFPVIISQKQTLSPTHVQKLSLNIKTSASLVAFKNIIYYTEFNTGRFCKDGNYDLMSLTNDSTGHNHSSSDCKFVFCLQCVSSAANLNCWLQDHSAVWK